MTGTRRSRQAPAQRGRTLVLLIVLGVAASLRHRRRSRAPRPGRRRLQGAAAQVGGGKGLRLVHAAPAPDPRSQDPPAQFPGDGSPVGDRHHEQNTDGTVHDRPAGHLAHKLLSGQGAGRYPLSARAWSGKDCPRGRPDAIPHPDECGSEGSEISWKGLRCVGCPLRDGRVPGALP